MTRNSLISISILTLGLAAACGDDAGSNNVDASTGNPDAGQTPDGGNADAATGGIDAAPGPVHPLLVEVYYDRAGGGPTGDNEYQWVKLYNPTGAAIDLSTYALGWGGANYAFGTLQLSGTIEADGCFVVGGPLSSEDNGNPVYDQAEDLDPNLGRGVDGASGVALFDITADAIEADTVPIDAVIYSNISGTANTNGLMDETGETGEVNITGVGENQSIRRLDKTIKLWERNFEPTPNECPPFPMVSI
jgi:hypothetical protein